jgi:hypothetical protein
MPDTAHNLFEELNDIDKLEFHEKARKQIHKRLLPQHRFLTDNYYDLAFEYWSKPPKLMEEFKPGLVASRAYFYYRDDVAAGRLSDYEVEYNETADASSLLGFASNSSVESILNNNKLLDLIKSVWPAKYLHYLEAILDHQPYCGSEIDNDELAKIVGVRTEDVRRALDCARRKLQRNGFSGDMIW